MRRGILGLRLMRLVLLLESEMWRLTDSLQNQDPVVGQFTPLLGIDAWEHAY